MKQNSVAVILVICICAYMFFGCDPTDDDSNTDASDLTAVKWQLQYFATASVNESLIDTTRITILFNKKGAVEGSDGCNTYFSNYVAADDGNMSISDIAATEMYCESPDGVMDQETKYLNALGEVQSFEIQANTLKLFYGDTAMFLFFVKAE
jgi:heat shock protein HslJ